MLRADDEVTPEQGFLSQRIGLRIPLVANQVPFDFRDKLVKQTQDAHGPQWLGRQPFEKAFPELSVLTAHLRTAKLTELRDHLSEEKQRTGDKFEILGLKIPVDTLGKFGFAVLVGLQLYFWIHLRAFAFGRKAVPPEVLFLQPWIGLYTDRIARSCYLASAVVLPLLSSLALVIVALPVRGEWVWFITSCVCFMASATLAVLTLREVVRAWKPPAGPRPPPQTSNAATAEVSRPVEPNPAPGAPAPQAGNVARA